MDINALDIFGGGGPITDMNELFEDMFRNPSKYREDTGNILDATDFGYNPADREQLTPSQWAIKYRTIKNKPFSFERYPYQPQIIDDTHPKIVIEKAAQLGLSEIFLSKVFWFCDYNVAGSGGKVIYTFPTYSDMMTYSSARIPPIIDGSVPIKEGDFEWDPEYLDEPTPYIQTMMRNKSFNKVTRVRDTFLFLKGTFNDNSAISVDSDWNIHDEVNFSNQSVLNKFKSRLGSASSLGWEYNFSTPTIPGFGVSKMFLESDQHWWNITCPHCGKTYKLEFEQNVYELPLKFREKLGKKYIYRCHHCKREISDVTRGKGMYLPEAPSVKGLRGYHIDKMCNPNISADALISSKEGYRKVSDFFNFDLGLAYSEKSTSLSLEILNSLENINGIGEYDIWTTARPEDYACMGVDQGDTLWVEISVLDKETQKPKIVYCESVDYRDYDDEDPFRRIPELMERFNVHVCVMDALPNKNSSRKLKNKYKGDKRLYVAYYTSTRDGDVNTKDDDMEVHIDRTETFKWCFNRIYNGFLAIPSRSEIMETWKVHMRNLKKETVEDENSGDIKEFFVKTGPDHFNHAHLYCEVARQILDERLKEGNSSTSGGIAVGYNPHWLLNKGFSRMGNTNPFNPNAMGGVTKIPKSIGSMIRKGR